MDETGKKNVFIVFAHPERRSLNGAILDVAIDALTSQGHTVTVSDLYEMGFDRVMSRNDIKGDLKNPNKFNWSAEMSQAYAENRVADDIRQEQMKLDAADILIFQFPLYWMGFPGILKNWFDRVIHEGYAADVPSRTFDLARFKGKRAMLSTTLGGNQDSYSDHGIMGDINITLWPLQNGLLRFVGYDVLMPNLVYGMDSPTAIEEVLTKWRHRLHNIFDEKPLFFFDVSQFENGIKLKKEVLDNLKGSYGPTTGQHCGKVLPPGDQTTTPN